MHLMLSWYRRGLVNRSPLPGVHKRINSDPKSWRFFVQVIRSQPVGYDFLLGIRAFNILLFALYFLPTLIKRLSCCNSFKSLRTVALFTVAYFFATLGVNFTIWSTSNSWLIGISRINSRFLLKAVFFVYFMSAKVS